MRGIAWAWWVLALLLVAFFWRFGQLASYILAAVAVSFAGQPLASWLKTRRLGRWKVGPTVAAGLTLASMAGLLSGVVMLFAPLVAEQLAALRGLNPDDLIRHWNEALATVDRWTAGIDMSGEGIANSAFLAEEASQWIQMEAAGSFLTDLLSSIGNVFVATFSILFMAFFFLQEPHLFKHFVLGLTPPDKQASAEKVMARSGELLTRYFGGLVIQVSIVTLIVGLGLTLVGVPHGWLLGLLAGLFNLIPYVGPLLGAGIGLLVMISSGVALDDLAWGMAVYLAAQGVDNVFTQPVVFAKRVFAHPLEIFVVVSVAGSLGGPAGMVLAIPGYTLLRIVGREFLQQFPWVQALTKSIDRNDQEQG